MPAALANCTGTLAEAVRAGVRTGLDVSARKVRSAPGAVERGEDHERPRMWNGAGWRPGERGAGRTSDCARDELAAAAPNQHRAPGALHGSSLINIRTGASTGVGDTCKMQSRLQLADTKMQPALILDAGRRQIRTAKKRR